MPRVPLAWLAESVDLVPGTSAEEVAAALVKVGLEEEGIDGGDITGPLVVGRVLSVVSEAQKNGKTINYCRVDVGDHNDPVGPDGTVEGKGPDAGTFFPPSRGIVCGAHNFGVGDYVPVVLPGATLPGPFPISARKTYGHISDGMICSAKELGIGEDAGGIIVLAAADGSEDKGYDADALTPGQDAIELLGLGEQTVEITVTPDRGYCFSIRGVAREYAHSTGQEFRDPAALDVPSATAGGFAIQIQDKAPIRGTVGCDRFVARIVRGVDPTRPSPDWMQRRLVQAAMRPISLAVDITNYVMLELGQPLHAYDLDKVVEPIEVRRAFAGEKLTTLDGAERALDHEDLLITDSAGGSGARPIGIAGVMGGASTEVNVTTMDILLEGAHFDPITIARSARRHKLGSEASRRFERGVDTALAPYAVQRAIDLLVEFGGGVADAQVTDVNRVKAPAAIELPVGFPARIVGIDFAPGEVAKTLTRIGCTVEGDDVLTVTPPTWRPDLTEAIDLVEEVGRLHGYEQMPSILPVAPPGRGYTHSQVVRRSVARTLAERGLTEVLTYPFISESRLDEFQLPSDCSRRNLVRLANPIRGEQPYMRSQLLQTLVEALKVNLGRGAQDVALFEIGRSYTSSGDARAPRPSAVEPPSAADMTAFDGALPRQPRRVAGVMTGNRVPAAWNAPTEAFDWTDAVNAALQVASAVGVTLTVTNESYAPWHPGRCASLTLGDGTWVGYAGELHPKVLETLGLPARTVAFELRLDPMISESEGRIVAAEPVAAQPLAKEDFAFIVDQSITAAQLVAVVREAGGDLIEDVRVFDVYEGEQVGEGKKSLAVNVRMRAADHTLSAEEVLKVREAIVTAAESLGAVLR
jgi:phenylalanyl-tRNA synthetase beta chain